MGVRANRDGVVRKLAALAALSLTKSADAEWRAKTASAQCPSIGKWLKEEKNADAREGAIMALLGWVALVDSSLDAVVKPAVDSLVGILRSAKPVSDRSVTLRALMGTGALDKDILGSFAAAVKELATEKSTSEDDIIVSWLLLLRMGIDDDKFWTAFVSSKPLIGFSESFLSKSRDTLSLLVEFMEAFIVSPVWNAQNELYVKLCEKIHHFLHGSLAKRALKAVSFVLENKADLCSIFLDAVWKYMLNSKPEETMYMDEKYFLERLILLLARVNTTDSELQNFHCRSLSAAEMQPSSDFNPLEK